MHSAARRKGIVTSSVLNPAKGTTTPLLPAQGGIHGQRNAFCAGMTSSANQDIFVFGGHSADLQWFRRCAPAVPAAAWGAASGACPLWRASRRWS